MDSWLSGLCHDRVFTTPDEAAHRSAGTCLPSLTSDHISASSDDFYRPAVSLSIPRCRRIEPVLSQTNQETSVLLHRLQFLTL